MRHQDVDAFRDEVPFIKQRLTSRQVEPPAIKPRGPAETVTETTSLTSLRTSDPPPPWF